MLQRDVQGDVATRDARQRVQADARDGAASQRRSVPVDPQHDIRATVGGEADVLNLPDRDGTHLHLVAPHELTRVDEVRRHLVAAPRAHQHHGDRHDPDGHAQQRERPRD